MFAGKYVLRNPHKLYRILSFGQNAKWTGNPFFSGVRVVLHLCRRQSSVYVVAERFFPSFTPIDIVHFCYAARRLLCESEAVLYAVLRFPFRGVGWRGAGLNIGRQAFSQAIEQQEGTGVVTGRVFCDDTNAPARFASVMLEPVSDVSRAVEEASRPRSSMSGQQPVLNTVDNTQTGMDGIFTVGNLKPGVYYVGAELPGYLSAVSGFRGDGWVHPSASVADHMAKELQRVTVDAGRTAVVNLTLERGASVNGTVSYSDGTPAAGISVKILLEKSDGSWEPVGMEAPRPLPGQRHCDE